MKSLKTTAFALVLAASFGIMACNPLSKMAKNAEAVKYSVSPDPLEMHNDSVAIKISVKYPPNYFHKKAVIDVVPTLKYDGKEKEFPAQTLQGEAADGDGKVINYVKGGTLNYEDVIPYDKGMDVAELHVKAVGKVKTKSKTLGEMKLADGTDITPTLVKSDDRPIMGKDKFVKVVPKSMNAQINYLINSSYVQPKELNQDDIKALKTFVEEGVEKGWVFKGMNSQAYASPDGEISVNENLANDRAESATSAIMRILKRAKVEGYDAEGFATNTGKGEDWNGFKAAMQASDIKDKDLIIRILSMYQDLNKREQEIKNLAATYVEVADRILPGLRRSVITMNAEEQARTDAEIQALLKSNPDTLSIEEMLYGATLTNDMNEQLNIFKTASRVHQGDWRGPNNVGYIYIMQNKVNDAEAEFKKADGLSKDNAIVKNNLGVCARLRGNRDGAMAMYNDASGAGADVNYNMAIIQIMKGDYAGAVGNMSGATTFNAALAKTLNGDHDGALKALEGSDDKATADGYYLKAIINAKKGDKSAAAQALKNAIAKDASIKGKAAKNVVLLNAEVPMN